MQRKMNLILQAVFTFQVLMAITNALHLNSNNIEEISKTNMNLDNFNSVEQSTLKKLTLLKSQQQLKSGSKCNAIPFKQTISKRGCVSVTIINNICYGQCQSTQAPLSILKANIVKENNFKQCFPDVVSKRKVLMFCPRRKRNKIRFKRVLMIHSCKCTAV